MRSDNGLEPIWRARRRWGVRKIKWHGWRVAGDFAAPKTSRNQCSHCWNSDAASEFGPRPRKPGNVLIPRAFSRCGGRVAGAEL